MNTIEKIKHITISYIGGSEIKIDSLRASSLSARQIGKMINSSNKDKDKDKYQYQYLNPSQQYMKLNPDILNDVRPQTRKSSGI